MGWGKDARPDRGPNRCYYVGGNAIEDSLRERDIGLREWRQACCFLGEIETDSRMYAHHGACKVKSRNTRCNLP